MAKLDAQSSLILSLLRDRPLSAKELAALLDQPSGNALECVRALIRDGLIRPLAGSVRLVPAGAHGSDESADELPLTITFRGMLNL